MILWAFWLSAFCLFYIYFGYPLLLLLLSRKKQAITVSYSNLPSVSILIAAYNEEKDIAATLNNKLALDYPREKLEILVVSDESIDGTDEIVRDIARRADVSIRLTRQVPRAGKTAGLNLLVPETNGEILVFSDANSIWAEDALRHLAANFADKKVGYVTGKMVYTNPDGSLVGDGCSAYMKYENWLRAKETLVDSVVGVDGGIDAMRKSLFTPLRADQLPDFVQPLMVVEKGYRVVYEPRALLKEDALSDNNSEYRMRVRVSLRALWAMLDMRALFNPFQYGLFALQFFSHKLLRYLAFVPLLAILVANVFLLGCGGFYRFTLLAQIAFYLLAWLGYRGSLRTSGLLAAPYYFSLLNVAAANAFLRFIKREKQVIWTPRVGQ